MLRICLLVLVLTIVTTPACIEDAATPAPSAVNLEQRLAALETHVSAMQVENDGLRAQNQQLTERVSELEQEMRPIKNAFVISEDGTQVHITHGVFDSLRVIGSATVASFSLASDFEPPNSLTREDLAWVHMLRQYIRMNVFAPTPWIEFTGSIAAHDVYAGGAVTAQNLDISQKATMQELEVEDRISTYTIDAYHAAIATPVVAGNMLSAADHERLLQVLPLLRLSQTASGEPLLELAASEVSLTGSLLVGGHLDASCMLADTPSCEE